MGSLFGGVAQPVRERRRRRRSRRVPVKGFI
jgi:hypothetical protein